MTWTLHVGDNREVMAGMDAESVDAVVCDPPYDLTANKRGGSGEASDNPNSPAGRARIGTGFMGKSWDGTGIAFDAAFWREALRVLKPGGHLVAFGGTRTYHRMACAVEDAGFEIRDSLAWMYGSGFPKSLNLGNGWGTALKPAFEPVVVARKPIRGTVAANVARLGTGGLNIDACRVATEERIETHSASAAACRGNGIYGAKTPDGVGVVPHQTAGQELGRWPPNLLLDPEAAEALDAQSGDLTSGTFNGARAGLGYHGANGNQGSTGGASRFFPVLDGDPFYYEAKASRSEREAGLGGAKVAQRDDSRDPDAPGANNPRNRGGQQRANSHPTVKPIALMSWLCKLVTPPGGLILDPFAGSGTTGIAALREGFRFVGIERDEVYAAIARRRIEEDAPLFTRQVAR